MRNSEFKGKTLKIGYMFLFFVFLVALSRTVSAEIISSSRRITWKGNVGIAGDIPTRTTIFANVKNPPYNAVGNGVADDTSAIQNAVNGCITGQIVYLPTGTYKISSPIRMKSGITLRGAGFGLTSIKGASGFTGAYLIGFETADITYDNIWQPGKNITGGLTKGSTSITVPSHGWSAGDIILIDQLQDAGGNPMITSDGTDGTCSWCGRDNGNRPIGQIDKIIATPDANTLTLEIPLYYNYDETKSPEASRMEPSYKISGAGIEDLKIDNSLSVNEDQENYGTVQMVANDGCWLLNVDVDKVFRMGVHISRSYRNTIRGSQVHATVAYTSNRGYGLWLSDSASACLIENNSFYDLSTGIIYNGTVSGNVIAYNYLTDMQSTDFPNAVRPGIGAHGAHPIMNLFEGNYLNGPDIAADLYWGTSSHSTYLRNRVFIDTTKSVGTTNLELWKGQTYYNFVGNIFGTDGFETKYVDTDIYNGKMIYCLDYTNSGSQNGETANTILRHGNYDYVNDSVVWDGSIADHNIPFSYYLDAKPSWWGDLPWPAIGPSLIPMVGVMPARLPRPPGNFKFK